MSLERSEPGPVFAPGAVSTLLISQPAASPEGNGDDNHARGRDSIQLALSHARDIAWGRGLWRDAKEAWGLSVRVEELNGTARLLVSGELDFASEPLMEECLARAQDAHRSVVVDLEGVTFMDSNGLDAFLHAAMRAQERGGQFRVENPHRHRRVFLITRNAALLGEQDVPALLGLMARSQAKVSL